MSSKKMHWTPAAILAASMTATPASSQDGGAGRPAPEPEPAWEFSDTVDGILIKTRAIAGTEVRQVFAETTFDGTPGEYEAVVTDMENLHKYMPYVKEGHVLKTEPDGGVVYTYLRLELPWPLSPRDYTTRRLIERVPDANGNGEFMCHWSVVEGLMPPKPGTVRVIRNDGFWHFTSKENGKVLIQHGFIVDPGGGVPMFAVNYGNRKGVPDMLKAVNGEVRRRRVPAQSK
jgi:hypothetical protein